jgi:hypothetical protein
MTTTVELKGLAAKIESLGGKAEFIGDMVKITGISGIGPCPVGFVRAAEMMREIVSRKAGAAVLGFRGAIRSCRQGGLDENRIFELVKGATND